LVKKEEREMKQRNVSDKYLLKLKITAWLEWREDKKQSPEITWNVWEVVRQVNRCRDRKMSRFMNFLKIDS
jgi:hypothetical protein